MHLWLTIRSKENFDTLDPESNVAIRANEMLPL